MAEENPVSTPEEQKLQRQQENRDRLAQLVRRGGVLYPTVRNNFIEIRDGVKCACAFASALLVLEPQLDATAVYKEGHLWPLFKATHINPIADVSEHLPEGKEDDLEDAGATLLAHVVFELFDNQYHHYSHEQIADWIETLPPELISLDDADASDYHELALYGYKDED